MHDYLRPQIGPESIGTRPIGKKILKALRLTHNHTKLKLRNIFFLTIPVVKFSSSKTGQPLLTTIYFHQHFQLHPITWFPVWWSDNALIPNHRLGFTLREFSSVTCI